MTDAPVVEEPTPRFGGRFDDEGEGLRERTARGTLVNAAFMVGLATLGFLRGFVIAIFLTTTEYGVWGVLVVALGTITTLKEVGVVDKFIQQEEKDQAGAFQKAFTLDTMLNFVFFGILLAATPVMTVVYGEPELLLPGFAICFAMLAASLQAPLWVWYRQMRFVRQRVFASIQPVLAFVVTVALAAAGLGYWSLVLGTLVGIYLSGVVIAMFSPYPLRFRYDRGTLKEYYSFSWPLFVAQGSGLLVAQISVFAGEAKLGLAGAGAITLASSIALYTNRVDAIVTQTLYPAICAVKDRTDLLFESFVKSNRLALMWGMPFGVALTLFAPDLVHFVLGDRWEPAVFLLQAFGLIAAIGHIGFNWTAFFRARGETRPIAIVSVLQVVAFLAITLPLLLLEGLDGFGIGMAAATVVSLGTRTYYLSRLFPGFAMITHSLRAIAPTVPAVLVTLAVRAAESGSRTATDAVVELAVYLGVTIAATLVFERTLIREVLGYLGRQVTPATR
jgi:O-antigen/teichoic acid export membrane protein